MEDLWCEFSARYHLPIEALVRDGILNEEIYRKVRLKILFVLKEANSDTGYDLCEFLKDRPHFQTWFAVARWAAGLTNGFPDFDVVNEKELWRKAFKGVAAINLKKTPGGRVAVQSEIERNADLTKDILRRQIKEI
ncbi:MAG: hypothetical protein C4523_14225 [Myxococcales bacterium]|nr:MAG: hypothetical protein C4523_14225 [Myxococcales bacterium]